MAAKPPLTKPDLDEIASRGCQSPGCTHEAHGPIFIHGVCHDGGHIEASYEAGSGVLMIACRQCRKPIARIAVRDLDKSRQQIESAIKHCEAIMGESGESALVAADVWATLHWALGKNPIEAAAPGKEMVDVIKQLIGDEKKPDANRN